MMHSQSSQRPTNQQRRQDHLADLLPAWVAQLKKRAI